MTSPEDRSVKYYMTWQMLLINLESHSQQIRDQSVLARGSVATVTEIRSSLLNSRQKLLRFLRENALTDLLPHIDSLIEDLSISERIAGTSPELWESVNQDLEVLPEFDQRYLRLNAEEPIRIKLTIIRLRLSPHSRPTGK